jgi:hypothetical protein
MLLAPNELSDVIRLVARDEAISSGIVRLTSEAELRISIIPPDYFRSEQIDVDINRLRSMILQVIKQAYLVNATIIAPVIEEALRRVKCHYLWFC